jgi:hypothetical protein
VQPIFQCGPGKKKAVAESGGLAQVLPSQRDLDDGFGFGRAGITAAIDAIYAVYGQQTCVIAFFKMQSRGYGRWNAQS